MKKISECYEKESYLDDNCFILLKNYVTLNLNNKTELRIDRRIDDIWAGSNINLRKYIKRK